MFSSTCSNNLITCVVQKLTLRVMVNNQNAEFLNVVVATVVAVVAFVVAVVSQQERLI